MSLLSYCLMDASTMCPLGICIIMVQSEKKSFITSYVNNLSPNNTYQHISTGGQPPAPQWHLSLCLRSPAAANVTPPVAIRPETSIHSSIKGQKLSALLHPQQHDNHPLPSFSPSIPSHTPLPHFHGTDELDKRHQHPHMFCGDSKTGPRSKEETKICGGASATVARLDGGRPS